jgi:hypothetical protein
MLCFDSEATESNGFTSLLPSDLELKLEAGAAGPAFASFIHDYSGEARLEAGPAAGPAERQETNMLRSPPSLLRYYSAASAGSKWART